MMAGPIKLDFSEKYDDQHAQRYLRKHQESLGRRLSHWRDEQVGRKALALAGDPGLVLDLPCGAGRFWPMLAEKPNRVIIGADNSESMIKTALRGQPAEVVKRVQPLHTSAFDIALPDNSVDSIFCMRLLHHIGEAEHRVRVVFFRAEPVRIESVADQQADQRTCRVAQQQPAGDKTQQFSVPPHGVAPLRKPGWAAYQADSACTSAGCRLLAREVIGTCWRLPLR